MFLPWNGIAYLRSLMSRIEQLAMDTDNISHISVFPQDIIISASKAKSVLAYNNKNIIRIKDYKIVEELKHGKYRVN